MAAGFLSKPGSKFGPCKTRCNHKDCMATRETARAYCKYCWGEIGFERRFFVLEEHMSEKVLCHEACAIEEQEKIKQITHP